MKVLGVSGSLKASSTNTHLIYAAALAPSQGQVELQQCDALLRVLEFRIAPDVTDNREILVGHGLFAP